MFLDHFQECCKLEIRGKLQKKHVFGNVSNSCSISFTQKRERGFVQIQKKFNSIQFKTDKVKFNFGKIPELADRVSITGELDIMNLSLIFSCTRSSPPGVTNSAATLTPRRTSASRIRESRTLSCRCVPL